MTGTDNTNPGNFANRYIFNNYHSGINMLTITAPRRRFRRLLPRVESPATLVVLPAWTPISRFVTLITLNLFAD
jgi:hypothetical protein